MSAKFFRRQDAAEFLRTRFAAPVSASQLAKLAVTGCGPAYRKFGRTPLYAESDLIAWAEARLGKPRRSTSEAEALTGQS